MAFPPGQVLFQAHLPERQAREPIPQVKRRLAGSLTIVREPAVRVGVWCLVIDAALSRHPDPSRGCRGAPG